MNRFANTGETAEPNEQCRVMRSAGLSGLVLGQIGVERCA
jgi:hypothetical protein